MLTDGYHGFLHPVNSTDSTNQIGLSGQGVKGRYGMPAHKTVNNYTIKCETKRKKHGPLADVLVPELFNSCSQCRKEAKPITEYVS